jgi:hypothetical protein
MKPSEQLLLFRTFLSSRLKLEGLTALVTGGGPAVLACCSLTNLPRGLPTL